MLVHDEKFGLNIQVSGRRGCCSDCFALAEDTDNGQALANPHWLLGDEGLGMMVRSVGGGRARQ